MSSPTKPKDSTGLLSRPGVERSYSAITISSQSSDDTPPDAARASGHPHHHGSKFRPNNMPEDTLEHVLNDAMEALMSDNDHDEEDEDTRWLRQARNDHKSMKWYKRPSLQMISAVMFMFSMAVGISASAKVQLLLALACKKVLLDPHDPFAVCERAQLQTMVSQLQGLISVTGAVVTTLLAGKIGHYSDIYGRRLTIIYILITATLTKVAVAVMVSPAMGTFHVWLIVGAHLIESFGGGTFVLLGMCNSYATDVVEDHARIYSIGVVIASLFLGMSIGPLLGSFIVKSTGSNMTVMYADAVITFMAVLFTVFILPESRSKNARIKSRRNSMTAEEMRRISVPSKKDYYVESFYDSINIFKPLKLLWIKSLQPDGSRDFKPRIVVLLMISIDVCLMCVTACYAQIIVLYGTYMFDWNAVDMGYYLALGATTRTFVLLGFSPAFLYFLKKRMSIKPNKIDSVDITCIQFAVCFQVISSLMLTFANNSYVYMGHSLAQCFESIATPAIHSAIIKYASVDNTGAMFGALATYRNLINLVFPATFLYIYSETVGKEPRITFFIQLVICIILVILTALLRNDRFYREKSTSEPGPSSLDEEEEALNAKLQKDARERIHRYMALRRESTSSLNSAFVKSHSKNTSLTGIAGTPPKR